MIEARNNPQSLALPQPLSLVCELTHRCPLHCIYCSNPLVMQSADAELSTETWSRVFREAAAMGIVHLHLTGGEPLARQDLPELIAAGREAGLYLNMITSGLGLTEQRLQSLVDAGLDHMQLSLQDADEQQANQWAGARVHAKKLEMAKLIKAQPNLAFTVNIVVHRQNLDRLEEMIALAESMGPERIEIAHVQYYGWALKNRDTLMPTRAQLERSIRVLQEAQGRLSGRIHLQAVVPDYFAKYPKACVGGWAQQLLLIDPAGRVLPCHSAGIIPGMVFDSVQDRSLDWIWRDSAAFNRFRGEDWMQEPCRSCDRKNIDFGGCRCQAMQILGDPDATDPACHLSPHHQELIEIAEAASGRTADMVYRILTATPAVETHLS
ncbi:pyrroloquinoline quinone biosynthesis protein PqqE [Granulicella sp. WH15]|uniref:pyrroloquinoline quinone biosynthesis protein PqqE n=1 Tax=Granulicella sp. WH15 TaxID=2602070 RepID=UPI001366AE29|nr:pyrroloquinoline quinone biosynthesis protein PqqE [Granulicella sp. WH15]QHN03232.1 pyrroloquinoline quinone biosynthesis protein PqqE [Granulicella sp. WH15]